MPAKSLIQFSNKYKALSPSLSLSFLCLFHLWLSYLQFHCNSSEERPAKSMLKSSGLQLSKQCDSSFCLLDLLTVWLKRDCTFQLSSVKKIPVQEGKRETFRERTELHDRLWTTTVGVNTFLHILYLPCWPCPLTHVFNNLQFNHKEHLSWSSEWLGAYSYDIQHTTFHIICNIMREEWTNGIRYDYNSNVRHITQALHLK